MALSRRTKVWLIVLSIPVIIIIGSLIALKIYFTSDRLKAFVVPRVEQAMNRPVAIRDISLSVFPTIAVEVDSVTIANRRGKGFSDKPFVSLGRLVLDVRLLPLFKGNLEVSTVILERIHLVLEINEDGIANYASEQQPEAETEAAERKPTATTMGVLFSNFQIVDGLVEYLDKKSNSATTIDGLNHIMQMTFEPQSQEAHIEGRTTVENFSYGSVTTPLISNLRIGINHALLYDARADVLKIEKGDCTVQEISLTMQGTVSDVTSTPRMDLVFEGDKINIAELLSIMPKEYMKKAEGLKGNGMAQVKLKVSGTVTDTTKPDVTGLISSTNASIQYAGLPKPITNMNIVMDFTRSKTKKEFRVKQFSALLGNNPLSARMTVLDFDNPSITLAADAVLNLAEMKDYYPLEPGTELAGTMNAKVNIAGLVNTPTTMKASGSLDFQNVTIKTADSKNPVQNLNGTINVMNQIVEAKRLSLTLGKSDLTLAFWVKNYLSMISHDPASPKPLANLTLTSNHIFTADLMSDAAQSGADKARTASATRQKGGLPLPNVDMDVAATIGTFTMEKFELKNVRGTMKISNGTITMQNFSFNTFDGMAITKGTLNLQKPQRPTFDFAMDINSINAHAMLPKFTSFGERLFGKLSMNTTMRGALDDTLGLIPQTVNGQGTVQIADGKLTGVKVNQAIASLLKLPDLEEIIFNNWSNTFTITDGRFIVKDLKITALQADYVVNGSQGLDGTLDFAMSLVLPVQTSSRISISGFAGHAMNAFKDQSGRLKLDFSVTGTTDAPKVALNTAEAQKRLEDLAKQKLTEEAKKLEEEAKRKGEELLKKLFKKK